MRVSRRAILPEGPHALVIVPQRLEAWVAMWFEHVVSILPISTRQRLATLRAGHTAHHLAVTPDGPQVWVRLSNRIMA